MATEKVIPEVRVRTSDKSLDLLHYQFRVLETALPPARSFAYQVPALLSEMGELQGVIAKEVRDSKGEPNYPARQAELGDIAYLTALLLNDLGCKRVTLANSRKVGDLGLPVELGRFYPAFAPGAVFAPVQVAAFKFTLPKGKVSSTVKATFAGHLQRFWCSLPYLTEFLLGSAPEYISRRAAARTEHGLALVREAMWQDVLAANVAKLADRANRGVLEGSGDYR